jgi:hypothetical protein
VIDFGTISGQLNLEEEMPYHCIVPRYSSVNVKQVHKQRRSFCVNSVHKRALLTVVSTKTEVSEFNNASHVTATKSRINLIECVMDAGWTLSTTGEACLTAKPSSTASSPFPVRQAPAYQGREPLLKRRTTLGTRKIHEPKSETTATSATNANKLLPMAVVMMTPSLPQERTRKNWQQ